LTINQEASMARKKKGSDQGVNITLGNISGMSGEFNVAGEDIEIQEGSTGLSAADIEQLFARINAAIDGRAGTRPDDRSDLKAEVQEIQAKVTEAVKQPDKVDEGAFARHFRNIARMAPDILDVVVATLGNPLAGIGVAVKKIADKAKAGTV
jgi:hypothetical protein